MFLFFSLQVYRERAKNRMKGEKDEHKCQECGHTFKKMFHLRQHMKEHMISFACSLCKKDFKWKKSLDLHMKVHDKSLCSFVCNVCQKTFCSRKRPKTSSKYTYT